jgi:NAD(P)-dependent dehydrogenase (short-subunit alcohol dehydrogenase family)
MTVRFDGRVVIVTGAGNGLGRSHALQFAERGAKVVVNDFGGRVDGTGGSSAPAQSVVAEIEARGGEAIAHGADVTNTAQVADMVDKAMAKWGRIDVLVNNAGILQDSSFAKTTPESFRRVVDVHLMGSAYCSLAVWPHMRKAGYGRIVMTASTSGVFGNFGQASYAAGKTAMLGLMNVLHIEGAKNGIHVNTIIPGAATRLTEGLIPPKILELMTPSAVSPAVLFLASEEGPSRVILAAGSGGYARVYVLESEGIYLPPQQQTVDELARRFSEISDKSVLHEYVDGAGEFMKFVGKAAAHFGVDLMAKPG